MKKYSCGIDIGSRTIKIVIFDVENKEIIFSDVTDTTATPKESAERFYNFALESSGISQTSLYPITATGYSREQFAKADFKVTEISCHAKGVSLLYPNAKTIIDIGGQDSKVIKVDNGFVKDFAMNDKCAAGTGRFLEVVSKIIEIQPDDMFLEYKKSSAACSISSMCVVFAESEIIGLLASGKLKSDILSGVLESLARRTISLAGRIGLESPIVFTGGVARNRAMQEVMAKVIGSERELIIPPNPSITGALGAAIIKV